MGECHVIYLLASEGDVCKTFGMPKITSPTPPPSPSSTEEPSPSPSAPESPAVETEDLELTRSRSETNLLSGEKMAPATEGAFSAPPRRGPPGSSGPEATSPGAQGASLTEELFSEGALPMSGDDILRTIEVTAAMEEVLIRSLVRQLKSPKPQTKAKRGFLKKVFDPKLKKTVPGPDKRPRTVEVQLAEDHIPSVSQRYVSEQERQELKALLNDLPQLVPENNSSPKQTEFHRRLTRILYQVRVPLHELRQILPIKETGSLIPLSRDATTKPAPEFAPVVSSELLEKARELGLVPPEEGGLRVSD